MHGGGRGGGVVLILYNLNDPKRYHTPYVFSNYC